MSKKTKGSKVFNKAEQYKLPVFDFDKLMLHIQQCVDQAPYGIVQLVVDLFCGAGGTSEGIEQARSETGAKCSMIIAGVNHDIKAIYSQSVNHPLAFYSTEDFRTANLDIISKIVHECRTRWPQCPVIVWGSFDCTNHSNAKGGMSRDADSRTLPWHIFRYLDVLKPDGLWVENVKEFSEWGPMMEKIEMFKSGKKLNITEPIAPSQEMDFYRKKIKAGWKISCPLAKNKKIRPGQPAPQQQPVFVPIKSLKGTYYKPWREKVELYGFDSSEWTLNAADYGVPQNRKRFFPMFMKESWPITKPKPTHAKTVPNDFSHLLPHVPIKNCLQFDVEGESIFTPGKIKSERSFERYYKGLIRFVAGGEEAFIAQRNSGSPMSKVFPIDFPSCTVTGTGGNQDLVKVYFLSKYMSNNQNTGVNKGADVNDPSPTITTQGRLGLVETSFITKYGSDDKNNVNPGHSIDEPSRTITTMNHMGLIQAKFIDVIYGNGTPSDINKISPTVRTKDGLSLLSSEFIVNYQGQSNASSVDDIAPTIMTREKLAVAGIKYFICNHYTGGGQSNSVDDVAPAVSTTPKSIVVKCEPWIMHPHFNNIGSSIDDPSATITANRKHHYIINPSYNGNLWDVNNPSGVIIARQDKSPPYLVTTTEGWFAIPVFKSDTPMMIKIKEFMALYGISDIKMRMLLIPELLKIQSFPANYYLAPGQTDQKKFIGNAVPPLLAQKIAESMYSGLVKYIVQKLKLAA